MFILAVGNLPCPTSLNLWSLKIVNVARFLDWGWRKGRGLPWRGEEISAHRLCHFIAPDISVNAVAASLQ